MPTAPKRIVGELPDGCKLNAEAEDAWLAYRALQLAACHDPSLLFNEFFLALQDTAYARFLARFER